MRNIRLFYALVIFLTASADGLADSRVVTRAELRTEGVTIRKIRHDTPMASLALETAVVRDDARALYQLSECIILHEEVAIGSLKDVDAGIRTGVPVARRVQSDKNRAVFLVLGKEVPRAYLAFTFRAPTNSDGGPRILLMPVSVAASREADPAKEPPTAQDASPAKIEFPTQWLPIRELPIAGGPA